MKRLLLILLLLCGTAHAAPPCWPSDVGGSGTVAVSGGDDTGQWVGWWCPDGQRYGVAAITGYALKHPPGPHASVAAMLSAYWALNVTSPWTLELGMLQWDMVQALEASRPPAWKVAPNGSYTTRPAYPVVDGVIGTKEAGRATVGQPCDCSAPIKRSAVTYCAAPGSALVTVCRN